MEILAEHTAYGEYVFMLILSGSMTALFLVLTIAWIVMSIKEERQPVGVLLMLLVLLAIGSLGLVSNIIIGPEVTYKAKITDFNEVYENGYEIVSKDGNLYTIKESQ